MLLAEMKFGLPKVALHQMLYYMKKQRSLHEKDAVSLLPLIL